MVHGRDSTVKNQVHATPLALRWLAEAAGARGCSSSGDWAGGGGDGGARVRGYVIPNKSKASGLRRPPHSLQSTVGGLAS